MDIKEHTTPEKLLYYSFLWNEARLVLAAIALFFGTPVVYKLFSYSLSNLLGPILSLVWIISGLAAGYLVYRWYVGGQRLFGGESAQSPIDKAAFFVSSFSGLHLGIAGFTGVNLGMVVTTNHMVFLLASIAYLASAYWLFRRWKEAGKQLF